ncbi:MAG: zinc-ribbon domain-containing protein [Hyphomicrobiales bacterium]|nr:zinc-ribbon domain-containing protein [Hyphomicrobiales bacterium]
MKQNASFILGCPECETHYEIPAAIPQGGRKVRCAKCSHIWDVQAGDEMPLAEFLKLHQDEEVDVVFTNSDPEPEAEPDAAQDAAPETEAETHDAAEPAPEPEPEIQSESADQAEVAAKPEPVEEVIPAPELESAEEPPVEAEATEDLDDVVAFYGDDIMALDSDDEPDDEPDPATVPEPELQAEPAPEPESGPELEAEPPPESDPEAEPAPDDGEAAETDSETEALDEEQLAKEFESALASGTEGEREEIVVGKGRRRRQLPAVATGLAAGWGALCLVLFGLGYLATSQRVGVVQALPGTAWVYEALGMPVNLRGLDFRGIDYTWETEAGRVVLQVHGDIVNISGQQLNVPGIVFALRDENETEVYKWEDEVLHEPLAAGERATFAVRIPTPPKSIKSVQVRFAKNR